MNEIIIVLVTMLVSFFLGGLGVLLLAGKTAGNYLLVKISRGKKVLLMGKTPYGWKSFVAKKEQDVLKWTFDKKPLITTVLDGNISRYVGVDFGFVDTKKPTVCIALMDGQLYPSDFDPQIFNNILLRALTRPDTKGTDDLKKMIILVLLAVLGCVVMNFVLLSKISALTVGGMI